jgi:uncharacterized protein
MQLEQQFALPSSPDVAWPAFNDVALLVDCLPGASITGPAVEGAWPLRLDVKLGPMAAAFVGQGRLHIDEAARSGRFEGQAADRRTQSRVKGAAAFQLLADGPGTSVQVQVDYTLTGPLAQFSRGGLVRELANALTSQFAAQLAGRLARAGEAAAPVTATAQGPALADPMGSSDPTDSSDSTNPTHRPHRAAVTPPAPAPLSVGALLLQALKSRWQQWLARRRRQVDS